jgi:uncharacterized membrane protein
LRCLWFLVRASSFLCRGFLRSYAPSNCYAFGVLAAILAALKENASVFGLIMH